MIRRLCDVVALSLLPTTLDPLSVCKTMCVTDKRFNLGDLAHRQPVAFEYCIFRQEILLGIVQATNVAAILTTL